MQIIFQIKNQMSHVNFDVNKFHISDLRYQPAKAPQVPGNKRKRFRDFSDIIDERNHGDELIANLKSGANPAANTVMEEAKKQIENRKKFLKNLSQKEISKVAGIQTLSKEGLDKARRAAELQQRIQSAMQRNNPSMPFRCILVFKFLV